MRTHSLRPLTLAALSLLALTGCQSTAPEVEVDNAWAKSAQSGMTGVFADITNPGLEPITLVAASSDAASVVELHEVVGGVMQQKQGGIVIEPGETHSLEPGADHIMLMGLTGPLEPGDTVSITLEFDSGASVLVDAQVRDYAGANEEYVGDAPMNHGGME